MKSNENKLRVTNNLIDVFCAVICIVSDVSFTVQLESDVVVPEGGLLKFDEIISNKGGGYGSNQGKFIPPVNGMLILLARN